MRDRIKEIRKDFKLNQTEFAEMIGLSRMMIAHVETGDATFSDRSISDICRIFKVNKEWLLTGSGEKYTKLSRNEAIAEFVNSVMEAEDNDIRVRLINGLSKLTVEQWKVINELLDNIK